MSKIKLSIGILTYNNSESLKKELACIFSQIKNDPNLEKEVEVIVSDNSENQDTKNMIETQFLDIPNFRYIKNEVNIGFDRNVDQILTVSNGLFCWTLSDNDLINEGGIKKVLSVIEQNQDSAHILICNSDTTDKEVKFDSMEKFLTTNNYDIKGGLISQNIYNKRFLPSERSQHYENHWFHLSILFETCAGNSLILLPNILKNKEGEELCKWANNGHTFITYTNLHSIIIGLKKFGYSEHFLNSYHKKFISGLPHQMVTAKLYGLKPSYKNLNILFEQSSREIFTFIFCSAILVCPLFVLQSARYLWKKL